MEINPITSARLAQLNSYYSASNPPPSTQLIFDVNNVMYKWNGTSYQPVVQYATDSSGNLTGLLDPNGNAFGSLLNSYIYNYNPLNYRKSRAAFNKVRAGVSNATIVRIGDSTEAGKGASVVGSLSGARPLCPTKRMADLLNSSILPAKANTFGADYNTGSIANLLAYDSRVSVTGGTDVWFGTNTLTGACFRFNGLASTLTLTADTACDTWEISYLDNSAAQWNWKIGAGAATQVNQANTSTIAKVTASGTAATTLTLTWVSGVVGIMHVKAYNAATKEVSIYNAGVNADASADFANSAFFYSSLNELKNIAPDLTFIRLGINDYNQATPITSTAFSSNIQTIITAAQISGDVVLCSPLPAQDTGTMTLAGQKAYTDALYALAAQNGCALIDHWRIKGSYPLSNALYYSDTAGHQNAQGYFDIAKSDYEFARLL